MDCPFYCAFGQVSSQATDYLPTNVPIVTIYKSQMFFVKYLTCPKKIFFHLVRYFVLKVTKCQSCKIELVFLRSHIKCVNLERNVLKNYGGGCHQKIGVSFFDTSAGLIHSKKGETDDGKKFSEWEIYHHNKIQDKKVNNNFIFPNNLPTI